MVFNDAGVTALDVPNSTNSSFDTPRPCAVKVENIEADERESERSVEAGIMEFESVGFWSAESDVAVVAQLVGAKLELAVFASVALVCPIYPSSPFVTPASVEERGRVEDEPGVFEGMIVDEQAATEDERELEDEPSVHEAVCAEQAEFEGCTVEVADKLEIDAEYDDVDQYPEVRETMRHH